MDISAEENVRNGLSRRYWLSAAAMSLVGCATRRPTIAYVTAADPNSPSGKETSSAIREALQGREVRLETLHLHGGNDSASFSQAAAS